jgi:tetratricopeptide (TPR) repeat protein
LPSLLRLLGRGFEAQYSLRPLLLTAKQLRSAARFALAELVYRRMLDMDKANAAAIRSEFAGLLRVQGNLQESAEEYRMALSLFQEQGHTVNCKIVIDNLAIVLTEQGNLDEANQLSRQVG